MAVGVGAQLQLFPEFVGFAVAVHDVQFQRHLADFLGLVARRRVGRFVRNAGMHGVVQVLVEHLPVRTLHDAEDAARDFDLAHRRTVAEIVDGRTHPAQEIPQRRAVLGLAGEHKAPVAFHPGHPAHRERRIRGVVGRAFQALLQRHAQMAAVQLEGPGMVRATEELADTALAVGHHLGALVRATVIQHVHAPVRRAHHQHILVAQARGVIVARPGHLAFMSHVDPGTPVDPLHLQIEDRGIGIDATVHAVAAHHRGQLLFGI